MFARIFALLLVIVVIYIVAIFVTPNLADQYGNQAWNERVRSIKRALESETGTLSIYEKLKTTTDSYVSESKSTIEYIHNTVMTKTEEMKNATESVQNAYTAVEKAKGDLQKLGAFSTGTIGSGSGTR